MRDGVDGDAVGVLELGIRAVGDESAGHHPVGLHVDDGVIDVGGLGNVAPTVAVHVERVAAEGHVGAGQELHALDDLVGCRVDDIGHGRNVIVVAPAGHPDLAVGVEFHPVQVGSHFYLLDFLEGSEVDYRHGIVVIGHAVTARVGHVELAARNDHLLRLVAHHAGILYLQRSDVNPGDVTEPVIGIGLHRASIRAYVGVIILEDDVAAVRNRDRADMPGGLRIHHLYQVRAVDHRPELVGVYGQVVAHVAQFLDDAGIALRIDVLHIDAAGAVVVVERAFVAAHVALVQQEEARDGALPAVAHLGLRGWDDFLGFPAGRQQEGCQQDKRQVSFHNIHDKINRKFVPGIG